MGHRHKIIIHELNIEDDDISVQLLSCIKTQLAAGADNAHEEKQNSLVKKNDYDPIQN